MLTDKNVTLCTKYSNKYHTETVSKLCEILYMIFSANSFDIGNTKKKNKATTKTIFLSLYNRCFYVSTLDVFLNLELIYIINYIRTILYYGLFVAVSWI